MNNKGKFFVSKPTSSPFLFWALVLLLIAGTLVALLYSPGASNGEAKRAAATATTLQTYGGKSIESWLAQAQDLNEWSREEAIHSLRDMVVTHSDAMRPWRQSVVSALKTNLTSQLSTVRCAAIVSLAEVGSDRDSDSLANIAEGKHAFERELALAAMSDMKTGSRTARPKYDKFIGTSNTIVKEIGKGN